MNSPFSIWKLNCLRVIENTNIGFRSGSLNIQTCHHNGSTLKKSMQGGQKSGLLCKNISPYIRVLKVYYESGFKLVILSNHRHKKCWAMI